MSFSLSPQDIQIADARLQGATYRDIEAQIGIDHSTVARRLERPELKAYIDAINARLISSHLDRSAANIGHAIDHYQDPPERITLHDADGNETGAKLLADTQLRDHGFKASVKLMEAAGILPSAANTSIYIQQIIQEGQSQTPEVITALFARSTHSDTIPDNRNTILLDQDVIDLPAAPNGEER